jgi:hypothetical protein
MMHDAYDLGTARKNKQRGKKSNTEFFWVVTTICWTDGGRLAATMQCLLSYHWPIARCSIDDLAMFAPLAISITGSASLWCSPQSLRQTSQLGLFLDQGGLSWGRRQEPDELGWCLLYCDPNSYTKRGLTSDERSDATAYIYVPFVSRWIEFIRL